MSKVFWTLIPIVLFIIPLFLLTEASSSTNVPHKSSNLTLDSDPFSKNHPPIEFSKNRRPPSKLMEHQLFPTSIISHWSVIPLNNLTCPIPGLHDKGEVEYHTFFYSLIKSQNIGRIIRGFLCSKARLVTTCYEGFFGTQHITKRISPLTLTLSEAELYIKRQELGEVDVFEYPNPSCGWLKTYSAQKDIVSCTNHPAHYNPVLQVAVDSVFDAGECKSSPCPSKGGYALWISKEPFSESCFKGPTSRGYCQGVGADRFIFGTQIGFYPLYKVCKMMLCGRQVLRLPDGVLIDTGSQFNVTSCPDHVEIRFLSDDIDSFLLERDMEQKILETMCLDTVGRLTNKKAASVYDLTHFYPNVPGPHRIYRINGTTIEASSAFFSWTRDGFDKNLLSHFTKAEGSSILNSFSGLTCDLDRKEVSLPYEASFVTGSREAILTDHSIVYHGPEYHHLANLASKIEDLEYTKEVGSLQSQITYFFSATKVIVMLAVLILALIACVLIYCLRCKKVSQKPSDTSVDSDESAFPLRDLAESNAPLWAGRVFPPKT